MTWKAHKIIIAVSCFSKGSIVDVWQGSECASCSKYPRVLNLPEFWIYQGSEYASGFEYGRMLIMPKLNMLRLHGGQNMPG